MDRAVVLMLDMLEQFRQASRLKSAADSGGVMMIGFAKAYDTIDRNYLMLVLKKFGFSQRFIDVMVKIHDGTTAKFLVNGELSEAIPVVSGIRQGYPLAPLLFILAVEPLGLAITQDKELEGIKLGNATMQWEHRFSAFVDDSTIFFAKAGKWHVPANCGEVWAFIRLTDAASKESSYFDGNRCSSVELVQCTGIATR